MKKQRSYTERTILTGGFTCKLTCEEQNEWNEFCLDHAAFKEFVFHKSQLDGAIASGNCRGFALQEYVDRSMEATRIMYKVAKFWYEETIKPRIEAENKESEEAQIEWDKQRKDKPTILPSKSGPAE